MDTSIFLDENPIPAQEDIRRKLKFIAGDARHQLDWLIERMAETGEVRTEDLRQTIYAAAAATRKHRRIKVRGYERRVA